jgi:hypothetical protein
MSARLLALLDQKQNINPPQRVIGPPPAETANVLLTFGKDSRSVKTVSVSGSYAETHYMEKQQREVTQPGEDV